MYTNVEKKSKNKEKIIGWNFAVIVGRKFSIEFTTMRKRIFTIFDYFFQNIIILLPTLSYAATYKHVGENNTKAKLE